MVKEGKKGPYVKLKLETDYQTGDIETVVWQSQRQENGTIKRNSEPYHHENMDEFAAAFPFNSSIVCVIRFVKLWTVNRKYGLTVKLVRANVLPPDKHDKSIVDTDDVDF